MKITTYRRNGLTLVEVMVVLALVGILAFLLLPGLSRGHGSRRIPCLNNLKQVGLAFSLYAEDHEGRFPWMVSTNFHPTNTSGSGEFAKSSEVFRHFQAGSNELVTPKILICPADKNRRKAQDFARFNNKNASYFVGLDADGTTPQRY